jgi:hypothetical protein
MDSALGMFSYALIVLYLIMLIFHMIIFQIPTISLPSILRIVLLHAFISFSLSLLVLPSSGWNGLILWATTYGFFVAYLLLVNYYLSPILSDRSNLLGKWKYDLWQYLKKHEKQRSIPFFTGAALLWIAYPLDQVVFPTMFVFGLAGLSFLLLSVGVGLEIMDLMTQRESSDDEK